MKRILIFITVGLALGVCGFFLLAGYGMRGEPLQTIIGTAHVDWLPASAKNVSLMKRSGFGAMEFIECTISESDFLALAEKKNWPIKEEKDVIYLSRIPELFNPDSPAIRRAFKAESRAPNGRGFSVVYDRDLLRMYYDWTSR